MKSKVLKLGWFALLLIGMTSCKNEEKELAEKRISELEIYVDSLKVETADNLETNWDAISVEFDKRKVAANDALMNLKDDAKKESQEKAEKVVAKYEEVKTSVMANIEEKKAAMNPNQKLRNTIFGAGKVGEDMNFSWVNKDNILSVYDAFYESYKANKANFSREDYDEVKLMYEALDSRKNTVEKEGLSSEDNGKIASIKFKFAPMFAMNRIGAKSRENAEAKE
jgi:hypothetical protein